jgi:hypothetical protein
MGTLLRKHSFSSYFSRFKILFSGYKLLISILQGWKRVRESYHLLLTASLLSYPLALFFSLKKSKDFVSRRKVAGKEYFVDGRLNEIRNVNNPHDFGYSN